jgi:hypothetical protein
MIICLSELSVRILECEYEIESLASKVISKSPSLLRDNFQNRWAVNEKLASGHPFVVYRGFFNINVVTSPIFDDYAISFTRFQFHRLRSKFRCELRAISLHLSLS